ncbi:MAG TPA: PfkB family carbohydrate kinase, partial [Burkholderiaceae bacterium]
DMVAHATRLPEAGETLVGQRFNAEPGGKGANQAVAATRLGAPTAFVGRVGTRQHGNELLAALANEGINLSGTVNDAAALPGIAVINVGSDDGENTIIYIAGSNAELSAADVRASRSLIQGARVVVAQLEVPQAAVAEAFALARAAGVTTLLNAAPALPLQPGLAELSDWLVVNKLEASALTGLVDANAAAQALLDGGFGAVVITQGAHGALLALAGQPAQLLPARAVHAVDTVGAGDTFVGGLACGLAEGMAPVDAVRLGQAAAAIAVSRSGVQSAMPRRDELNGMVQRQVIFDTDPGIDDAMALWLLARHPAIRLRAVTSVFGNAAIDVTTRNALALSRFFGAKVPVARGAGLPLDATQTRGAPAHVHGDDALGGMFGQLPVCTDQPDPRPAHELICEMVNAEPGQITLLAVGPLTNLALALRHDPGIAAKVREVVVMGGAFGTLGHSGNVTPVAEANIINDPAAADMVFTAAWPVVIVGLDVTQEVVMSSDFLAALRGRGQVDGSSGGDFLHAASRFYQAFYAERDGVAGIYSHDASAAAYLADPALFTLRSGPVRVVQDGIAVGQTIQDARVLLSGDPLTAWSGLPVQRVCVGVNAQGVRDIFNKTFDQE